MKTTLRKMLGGGILAMALPMTAAAATIQSVLQNARDILNWVIIILFVLVTLYFIWGVVQYVSAAGDEEKLKKGKDHMIWGIIGMVVMAAAWGIVAVVMQSFGISGGGPTSIPTINVGF